MRILFILLFAAYSNIAGASLRDDIRNAISEAAGPPGKELGEKSNITVVNAEGNVTFIFVCGAGKEDGFGDKAVDIIFNAVNGATGGFSTLFKHLFKGAIARGFVVEGDAFCGAIAMETGSKKRAKNVTDGSIYVTSWRDGKVIESVTDRKYCKKIQKYRVCYEIAEGSFDGDEEIDGVSGCFQAKINGKLVSYSFGRVGSAPEEVIKMSEEEKKTFEEVKKTFSIENSKSSEGCVARSLGVEKY